MVYRERSLPCTACRGVLEDARDPSGMQCNTCRRLLVAAATVQALLEVAAPDVRFRGGVTGFPRSYRDPRQICPACRELMRAVVLFDTPVDQCDEDGFWVSPENLALIVDNAHQRYLARRRIEE